MYWAAAPPPTRMRHTRYGASLRSDAVIVGARVWRTLLLQFRTRAAVPAFWPLAGTVGLATIYGGGQLPYGDRFLFKRIWRKGAGFKDVAA